MPLINAGAPMFTAKGLAAAEERGRRAGIEEAAALCITEAETFHTGLYFANGIRALAPRDSGLNAKVGRSEDGLPVVNFDRDVLHGKDRK